MVQWLGLCTSTAGDLGLTPVRGTKIPQAMLRGQNNFLIKKIKIKGNSCTWGGGPQMTEAWKRCFRAPPVSPADHTSWQWWGSSGEEWLFPGSRLRMAEKQTQSGGSVRGLEGRLLSWSRLDGLLTPLLTPDFVTLGFCPVPQFPQSWNRARRPLMWRTEPSASQ